MCLCVCMRVCVRERERQSKTEDAVVRCHYVHVYGASLLVLLCELGICRGGLLLSHLKCKRD